MYRPRLLINIFLLNAKEDKILILKKFENFFWELVGEKLNFGEQFDECVKRVLYEETTLKIDDFTRIKFVCSYNAVEKVKKKHFISVNYVLTLTEEEEKSKITIDPYRYQHWKWITFDEMQKMNETFFYGVQIFMKNYKIKSFSDIKTIKSN